MHIPQVPVPEKPQGDSSGNAGRAGAIAAAAATVTAIMAIVIAIWDNVQSREHNRLSVMPYVVIERIQHDSSGVARGEITVSNEGVGPAILRGLQIRVPLGGANGTRDTTATRWGSVASIIQRRGLQIQGWADVDSGSALGIQRGGVLLRVEAEGEGAASRIQEFFDHLRLRLRYASVYGDPAEAELGEWEQP
jgi:hypothetical protein